MNRITKYIIIFFIIEFISLVVIFSLNSNKIKNYTKNKMAIVEKDFKGVINAHKHSSFNLYGSLVDNQDVYKILEKAQDTTKRDLAREELWELLKDPYNNLKKLGLKQFHFHLPNGDSFLRFHKPKKFGDNLFHARESVRIANIEKEYAQGFEEGKIFNGYRFVFPIVFNEKHLGSVETSISMEKIISDLRDIHKDEYTFIIKKDVVEKKLFKDLIKKNYEDSIISNNYYREKSFTHTISSKLLNEKLKEQIENRLNLNTTFMINSEIPNGEYLSVFLPIKNFKEETVAYLIIHTKKSLMKSFRSTLILNTFMMTMALILILFFMYKNEKKHHTLKILNETLESKVEEKVQHINKQNEMLMKNSKMVAMGEMIGAISHQWKQPLNAMALIIQDLEDANEFKEITPEYIDNTVKISLEQIEFMNRTITDFKNFLKPDKDKETFAVKSAVDSVISILHKQLTNLNITVTINAKESIFVTTYRGEVEQIILNLINNAKDALGEKSIKNPMIEISLSTIGEKRVITVEDNAGGIPEKIIGKIFDSHFTTKADDKGTGIGLYISRMIAEESLMGELKVENTQKGALFTLTF